MSVPLPSGADIARRRLHMIIAVDCSGSMQGDKIASLNHALRIAVPAMRESASENPETDVFVRALRFSDGAHWHVGPVLVDQFEWEDVTADGTTDMGHALKLIAQQLTPAAMPGRQLPPVVVLLTDGQPTDDFNAGLKALMDSPYGGKSLRVAIAIGSDADLGVLQRFIGHPEFKPLRANNAQDLVRRIKWATTTPVKTLSSGVTGSGAVEKLASESGEAETPDSSISVW